MEDNENEVNIFPDDPKFTKLFDEREKTIKEIDVKIWKRRLIIFFSVLIFYVYVFLITKTGRMALVGVVTMLYSATNLIHNYSTVKNVSAPIFVFLLVSVFAILPDSLLYNIEHSDNRTADDGTPTSVLRLFGWFIYLIPLILIILYLLTTLFN